jgi:general secretion pathway protein C
VLSVDDKPARVVRLGGVVDGEWVLQGVTARGVSLGPAGAPAQVTLELPQLPPPATGTLPGAVAGAMPGALPPVQPQMQAQMQPQMQPPVQSEPPPDQAGTVTGGVVDPNQAR